MSDLKLLLRFDDLCPTMDKKKWERAEKICRENGVKPIIAVIPENKDPLFGDEPDPDFWIHIKKLQQEGWCVGLHGLTHTFCSKNAGIMGITALSEFVPKTYAEQETMIKRGLKIFREHGIEPDLFIAPCHSFDKNTLKALKNNGIHVISDGFYTRPVSVCDMSYIPCQLWERSKIPKDGFFTVCCHAQNWSDADAEYAENKVKQYKDYFISVADIGDIQIIDFGEKFINRFRISLMKLKNMIKRCIGRK